VIKTVLRRKNNTETEKEKEGKVNARKEKLSNIYFRTWITSYEVFLLVVVVALFVAC